MKRLSTITSPIWQTGTNLTRTNTLMKYGSYLSVMQARVFTGLKQHDDYFKNERLSGVNYYQ